MVAQFAFVIVGGIVAVPYLLITDPHARLLLLVTAGLCVVLPVLLAVFSWLVAKLLEMAANLVEH